MKYLIDFLDNPSIENTHIFSQLKCTVEEAKILQLLTRKFLQSQEDVIVAELLQELGDDLGPEPVAGLAQDYALALGVQV